MAVKVAINGFGRIGRLAFRQMFEAEGYEVVAINDLTPIETIAHLLKYDSTQGKFDGEISIEGDYLVVDGHKILITVERDPANLPWKDLGVDVVLESTGLFTKREAAAKHMTAGAKRVIVLEKCFAVGIGGIVATDVRLAMDGLDTKIYTVVAGLGGRNITRTSLHRV